MEPRRLKPSDSGVRALSIDSNPLASIIGRAKTVEIGEPTLEELRSLHARLSTNLDDVALGGTYITKTSFAFAPNIPNRAKWYSDSAFDELCHIKALLAGLKSEDAQNVAKVALSRMAVQASFQDSETRYKSVPRQVLRHETLRRYLRELEVVVHTIRCNSLVTRFGISSFIEADFRNISKETLPDGSVDLIVTSPPYGNATDYHLYHRFRLLWLDFDPAVLSKVEIGSHLRHQREGSGFRSYLADLKQSVAMMARALRPGRYAVIVLGDSIYGGQRYDPVVALTPKLSELGFELCGVIERPIHSIRRSFVHAARRAISERLLVLRKFPSTSRITLMPPPYRLWSYEGYIRLREAGLPTEGEYLQDPNGPLEVGGSAVDAERLRGLVFSHSIALAGMQPELTWQAILENGTTANGSTRKDPKYATHGIHPYKGKYYPQLARGLINLIGLQEGMTLLDPFCGSGTTLLEGYLNGLSVFGCDMHPLAVLIARAKIESLEADPWTLQTSVAKLLQKIHDGPRYDANDVSEFAPSCLDEITRWFPDLVIGKINWLLKTIRQETKEPIRQLLEVILSSIIRDVSHQEPSDLRIRYRINSISDADVFGLYETRLRLRFDRIRKFWNVRSFAPGRFYRAHIAQGDNRELGALEKLGLSDGFIDAVVTSPPYAMALPYIVTDRLSLLVLLGISSADRRPLELGLMGSREITTGEYRDIMEKTNWFSELTPAGVLVIERLKRRLAKDETAGFRRRNMPALMARYLMGMRRALSNSYRVCKAGAEAMIVIGDSKTQMAASVIRIPTTDLIEDIAKSVGFEPMERFPISVTRENMLHQKHSIKDNVVLRFRKPRASTALPEPKPAV